MSTSDSTSPYVLGNSDFEHERLIRQAAHLSPCTERFFRDAGIGPNQRVLDIGSGVGDVALLLARLVGPSGEVVGIERDPRSISRARVRAAEAGLPNVSFIQSDVSEVAEIEQFDAAVGRFILEFLPDPVAILRSLAQLVRPGGILAFQEPSYAPFLLLSAHLPLWSATARLIRETLWRSGANTEIGLALHQIFQDAGLPAPTMRMEMLLGNDPDFIQWIYDLLCGLWPRMKHLNIAHDGVGALETLRMRLQAEVAASKTAVTFVALVGAWSHRSTDCVSR